MARIHAAGGWVEFNRVNGNLALSRAFGDYTFKNNPEKSPEDQIVTGFAYFVLLICLQFVNAISNSHCIIQGSLDII